MMAQEVPLIARRRRADFPQSTAGMSAADLLVFTRACADQVLAKLQDVEQVYRLAAVNANLARIEANRIAIFDGAVREDLAEVAPWLFEVSGHAPVYSWFAGEGFGKGWGIALHSCLPAAQLKARLKRFLKITDEKGDGFFIKFYVPRNLNAILPELDNAQRKQFFSGIEAIYAEDFADSGAI